MSKIFSCKCGNGWATQALADSCCRVNEHGCKNCDTPAEDCGNTQAGAGMLPCCDFCNHGGVESFG